MIEVSESKITLGYERDPKDFFDEIEHLCAAKIREGWRVGDYFLEENLSAAHIFFERDSIEGSV